MATQPRSTSAAQHSVIEIGEPHPRTENVDGHTIRSSRWGVEVSGLRVADARLALSLLASAKRAQYLSGEQYAERILAILGEADEDFTPPASIEQARRLADHRRKLLTTPTYTLSTLGQVLGTKSDAATRTWLSRRRSKRQLFTVTTGRHVVIPAFQLNEDGSPRVDLVPVLATLLEHRVDGWALWTWLTEPTPLLSGAVPERLAATAPERTQKAAFRFAARNRSDS